MATVTEEVGGLVNARSMGSLPKSREQVSYYKHRDKGECSTASNRSKSEDVLYNVMLQCKSSNPSDAFVRTVVAAPEPMAVLCTDQQMVRFLTNPAVWVLTQLLILEILMQHPLYIAIFFWSTVLKSIVLLCLDQFQSIIKNFFRHIISSLLLLLAFGLPLETL